MATNSQLMKVLSLGVPTALASSAAVYLKMKRDEYMGDPVLARALAHLKKDYRVVDFCGQQLEPGWMITREKSPGENWVKYDLQVKGAAGKLKIKIIGDYLTHEDLSVFDQERDTYLQKVAEHEQAIEKQKQAKKGKEQPIEPLDIDYIPVDFDAYSILPREIRDKNEEEVAKGQQVWRISSLTAQVDDDTRILVLPVPESKRATKIQDTFYNVKSYSDLISRTSTIEERLAITAASQPKLYEDKTQEEIERERKFRQRQRMEKIMRVRTYQFGGIGVLAFMYIFVYRKFMHPKPVLNSVVYHQAVSFVQQNKKVQQVLGPNFQIMLCQGKMQPWKNEVQFDLNVYGTTQKGKLQVHAEFDKSIAQYKLKNIDLKTMTDTTSII